MFDIGFAELLIIGIISLVVLGPERLPVAMRTTGLWIGRIRRTFRNVKQEIEREVGADEIRRQLYNEEVMRNLKRIEEQTGEALNADRYAGIDRSGRVSTAAEQQTAADAPSDPPDSLKDFGSSATSAPAVVSPASDSESTVADESVEKKP